MMHIAFSDCRAGFCHSALARSKAVQLKLGLLGCAAGAAAAEELAAARALAGFRRGRVVRGWAGELGSNSIVQSGAKMPRRNLAKQARKPHCGPSRPADATKSGLLCG